MTQQQSLFAEPEAKSGASDFIRRLNRRKAMNPSGKPLLTTLNYSAGKQSEALLWMVLNGEIPMPPHFVVLNADPGMENSGSYRHVARMQDRCDELGITMVCVKGPNLYKDLVTLKVRGESRISNPPYWTKNPDGTMGRLTQRCTEYYKIAPMDREVRRQLFVRHGISETTKDMPFPCVEKWLGFAADETHRISEAEQQYVKLRFPLVELGITKAMVEDYYVANGLEAPPRSVCNACFANGLTTYKEMYHNRPADWEQAVAVDDSVRDWKQIAIRNEVYVSNTLIPLRDMPKYDFDARKIREAIAASKPDQQTLFDTDGSADKRFLPIDESKDADEWTCDSGHCFL